MLKMSLRSMKLGYWFHERRAKIATETE